ncbi:MAG: hypothetical protein QG656_944 [Candidatus Hydrogenedentes bacterium]|nr:hypothetical protein [Candidatus Hydrogenedentota bacterium]
MAQQSESPAAENRVTAEQVRAAAPLAGVLAASAANWLTLLALPGLNQYHRADEWAFFFGVPVDRAAHWLNGLASVLEPIGRYGAGVQASVPWSASLFLLMFSPLFGATTLAFLLVVFARRPVIEKVAGTVVTVLSLPISLYACAVIWFALMKTHYVG